MKVFFIFPIINSRSGYPADFDTPGVVQCYFTKQKAAQCYTEVYLRRFFVSFVRLMLGINNPFVAL